MRYLRTAPTRRLLATIVGVLATCAACAAIAVAATATGPVPRQTTLAKAVHRALVAGRKSPVTGVSANITFTDNLIDSADLTSRTVDPLLQGASGRLWWSANGRFRLELQSDDGDAQVVVDQHSWWISDPAQHTVYKGTLSGSSGSGSSDSGSSSSGASGHGIPTVAAIESALTRLMQRLHVGGPTATDVGGQPAYRVAVSPKTSGGLIGSVQLAWDAARGVPLQFDIYARGDRTPVLGLQATSISYGPVSPSVFEISPPAGAQIVNVGSLGGEGHSATRSHRPAITGVSRVAGHLSFAFHPPATVDGQPLRSTRLIGSGSKAGALLLYGRGLGTIVALETPGSGASSSAPTLGGGLSIPTRRVDGVPATVLSTPLGTILRLTHDRISYTITGSITASSAQSAAGALAAGG
jgi:outer membrane lipoprotein-sorting protein